jgi:hypothetical protein
MPFHAEASVIDAKRFHKCWWGECYDDGLGVPSVPVPACTSYIDVRLYMVQLYTHVPRSHRQ